MTEERVHRRLAAILAADVVGYSRLMEQEEAGTLARFRSLRTEIIDPRIARDGANVAYGLIVLKKSAHAFFGASLQKFILPQGTF